MGEGGEGEWERESGGGRVEEGEGERGKWESGGGSSCFKLCRCVWWRGTDLLPSYMWNTSTDQWAFCVCVHVCVCVCMCVCMHAHTEGKGEGLDHIKCHSLFGACSKTIGSKQTLWLHAECMQG